MKNKALISLILVCALILSLAVFASADNSLTLRLGDTDGDGEITTGDALNVLQYAVGKRDKFPAEESSSSSSSQGSTGGDISVPELNSLEELEIWITTDELTGYFAERKASIIARGDELFTVKQYYRLADSFSDFTVNRVVAHIAGYEIAYSSETSPIGGVSISCAAGSVTTAEYIESLNEIKSNPPERITVQDVSRNGTTYTVIQKASPEYSFIYPSISWVQDGLFMKMRFGPNAYNFTIEQLLDYCTLQKVDLNR